MTNMSGMKKEKINTNLDDILTKFIQIRHNHVIYRAHRAASVATFTPRMYEN